MLGNGNFSVTQCCVAWLDDYSKNRQSFCLYQLAEIRQQTTIPALDATQFDTLSMGMSADMDEAIRAGSTMVRVGTAIFGQRNSNFEKLNK